MKKSPIVEFTTNMWQWYRRNKRLLPWRDLKIQDDTERAYRIFVSEMMLQQTQASRVIPAFDRFLKTFPAVSDLANASNRDVILAWQGMGYNMRALRMRDAARTIMDRFGGRFPKSEEELLSIKGIGPYTAAAILNFAFDIPAPCTDVNIERILRRVFIGPVTTKAAVMKKATETLTIALETNNSPKDWHAALMDFGSLVCTKKNPKCETCPLQKSCKSAFKAKEETTIKKAEAGRVVFGKHIPNRIFRGRIVEALRTHHDGLPLSRLGKIIAPDYAVTHEAWLKSLVSKLQKDELVSVTGSKIRLKD